jgi:hypothetical protein
VDIEQKKQIKKHLCTLKSAEDIFELFKLLNYPEESIFDTSYKRDKTDFNFKKEDYDRINNVYSVLNFEKKLPVFLLETKSLAPSFIRSVTKKFDSQYMWFLLIFAVSNDYSEVLFVLPDREKVETGTYKLKLTKLTVDKDEIKDKNEYYTVIETISKICYEKEVNWRFVWKKWKEAFNVEKVTESFFEDYKKVFFNLRNKIKKQGISQKDSHEFTLQFLNRIMFTYFISKKGWLKYPKFMNWFWTEYKKLDKYGSNEFYEKWLNQVFFKAFNNLSHEIVDLPPEIKETVSSFPYLNGGLFAENDYDLEGIEITDTIFQKIFEFFEKYNFTIKENMPLESEVAVNPQMIGYVYESLANVADEIYDRNDMGIFYTHNVEVDFMCKRSLVEYFSKNLPNIPKEKIYHFVFDLPEDKGKIEEYFSNVELWHELEDACDNLSVVDPACGSGAFLVGMLNVLDELYKIIYKHTERDLTDFERKYRIIQYSLYGVDVMPWAIHAAELRLWLQLIIETELNGDELRKSPLLPNLNLNLRIGDSLVQEVGGVSFNVRSNNSDPSIKKALDNLKREKRLHYENSRTARFKNTKEFKKEEIRLFKDIIDSQIRKIREKIDFLQKDSKPKQSTLGIRTSEKVEITDKKRDKSKKEIKKYENDIQKLQRIKEVLKDPKKKPFVWDIDFAEIFWDKNGFDIVIGNPPYVRQEMISPPNKIKSNVTLKDRQEYKDKLISSVQEKFPVVKNMDKRSDYYIYFYFHGLSLLNETGTFCFITSNSWLDVGYGKNLQEFLLNYVPITAIYDNPKRSFAHADVNTVIALFGAPIFKAVEECEMKYKENDDPKMLGHTAKFIMFKKPFESVVNTKNLLRIEAIKASRGNELVELVKNVVKNQDYRVFPVIQGDLLHEGWKYPKSYDKKKGRFKSGSYESNKWGGKYLRAPDIFFTILKKAEGKIVKLSEVSEVKRGFTTGVNDFFYLPSKYFDLNEEKEHYKLIPKKDDLPKGIKIEKKFLKPMIKSPKEVTSIKINPKKLKFRVFLCNLSKKDLKNYSAINYIQWGENQIVEVKSGGEKGKIVKGYQNLDTLKNRKLWYDLGKPKVMNFIFRRFFNQIFNNPLIEDKIIVDQTFYGGEYDEILKLGLSLNSTVGALFIEMLGRSNLGEGVLQYAVSDANNILLVDPKKLNTNNFHYINREILSIFEECNITPLKPIREQDPQPLSDRLEFDKVVFDEIGLNKEEIKDVYWSVCELVKNRLDKANSLNGGK